jgi:Fe-Mn family superoxide dismutase
MRPPGAEPSGRILQKIEAGFGGVDAFKKKFQEAALGVFGTGWAWLVENGGSLAIEQTEDADNPMTNGKKPLLTCDVWEHAYYIDYRDRRAEYVEKFWKIVNWEFVGTQL